MVQGEPLKNGVFGGEEGRQNKSATYESSQRSISSPVLTRREMADRAAIPVVKAKPRIPCANAIQLCLPLGSVIKADISKVETERIVCRGQRSRGL